MTSPGGAPDPWCPRASSPSSPRPQQPCGERAHRMGRGSRFELWAPVAQIKGLECLASGLDFLGRCPPPGGEIAHHSRPLRVLGAAPLLPLLPPSPEQ